MSKTRFQKGHKSFLTEDSKKKLKKNAINRWRKGTINGFKKGVTPWNKGKKDVYSKDTLYKMRMAKIILLKHKGPYSVDWTETLKRSIRERDNYTCKLCGEIQNKSTFHIHHIDYDKQNCNPNNLITLCRKCHTKTNFNRDIWTDYFKKIITY